MQPTLPTNRLRLEKDALIEPLGRDYIAYGRWDCVFGAWRWRQDGTVWHDILPDFALVDRAGEPLRAVDPPPRSDWEDWNCEALYYGVDCSAEIAEQYVSHDRKAMIEFGHLVPPGVRMLAARIEHPTNQWLLCAALWARPNLDELLRIEFAAAGNAYLEACLLLRDFRALSPHAVAHFLHDALTRPRHHVLSTLTGHSVKKGDVPLVVRLRRFDMLHKKIVRRMLSTINTPHLRAVLAHRRTISWEILAYLDVMSPSFIKARCLPKDPPEFETNGAESADLSEDDFYDSTWLYGSAQRALSAFRSAMTIYRTLTCEDAKKAADNLIRSIRCPNELLVRFQELDLRHLRWNTAPWRGNAKFHAISDYRTLRATALEFENCARDRLPSLLDGTCALYLVSGFPSVLLELCRDHPTGDWCFGDFDSIPVVGHEAELAAAIRRNFIEHFASATGIEIPGAPNPS